MAIQIGKYIHFCLSQSADLVEVTDGKIYPVHAPELDTLKPPFLIYWVEGIQESSTKDGIYGDTATVGITLVAKDYDEKMDILPLVRNAMADGWTDWNNTESETVDDENVTPAVANGFSIDDQTMSLGPDEWDLETGFDTSTFTYTIETCD